MTSQAAAPPSGQALAKAWSEAPAFMAHGAGCACAGHVAMHVEPAAVEEDVLDYLAGRYQGTGQAELVAFVASRRAARGVTFATWLATLDTAQLSPLALARLLADLDATISSLAQAR